MAGQRVYMFNPNDEQWSFAPCAGDAADDQRGLVHMVNFGRTSDAADDDGDATLSGEEDKPAVEPLKVIHGALRGRYLLAIGIALVGLIVGALIGYRFDKPIYNSVGLIRIKPNLPRILYQNEQNSVMPMFDSFMESQVSLIRSQAVVDLAMQHPDWEALGRGLAPDTVAGFGNRLLVGHYPGSELISVSFTDTDPTAAMIAVRCAIDAYQKRYGDSDLDNTSKRLEVLENRRTTLTNELKGVKDRIAAIANEFGSDKLDKIYDFKVEELNKLESQLKLAELAEAASRGQANGQAAVVQLTPEMVATVLPEMQTLLQQRLQLKLTIWTNAPRLGEKHSTIVEARARLEEVQSAIDDLLATYKKEHGAELPAGFDVAAAGGGGPLTAEALKQNVADLRGLFEKAKTETLDLGRKSLQIGGLREEADAITQRLDETKNRIEQLSVESSVSGRINVISAGDRPLRPYKDRRKAFAAAGGLGFAAFGVGMLVLVGLLDRRVRYIADAQFRSRRNPRLLGVLPELPTTHVNHEQSETTAYGVHQIRAALQRRQLSAGCSSIAVTSSSPGAGKTSLTMALGVSFATCGAKTLLIDCDIIGGGLSRLIGKMNGRSDLVNELLEQQRSGGLLAALRGKPIDQCIVQTEVQGMYFLPLGPAGRQHIGQISPALVARLLKEATDRFETVLIDTGPVLGSVEASIVAAAVDQVVLAITCGEPRHFTERALHHLDACGARLAGTVFNRASVTDIVSSGYSSSGRVSTAKSAVLGAGRQLDGPEPRLGPIGSAVMSLTESSAH